MSEKISDELLADIARPECGVYVPEVYAALIELKERRAGDELQQRLNAEQNKRITELEEKLRLDQEIVARLKNAVPQIKAAAHVAKLQVPGSEVQLALMAVTDVGGRVTARFTFEVLEDVAKLIGVEDVAQPGLVVPSGPILS